MRRALVLVVAGCVTPYQPEAWPIAAHRFECLDVGVQAGQRSEAVGPVVVVRLGNRCDHRTLVDLGALRVRAGDRDLTPFDPDGEIRPRPIDAFGSGEEWLEYEPGGAYTWLDVDIGRVAGGSGSTWVRIEVPR